MANNHVLVISIGFKLYSNLKQMRVFDSPGQDTNPSQVSSQQTLLLIYLYSERMESWVSLGGKECRTNIWFSAEPGIELCTLQLWLARRHLTNYTNHACQTVLQLTLSVPVVFLNSPRSEEHTSELQSRQYLVCRLLLEKKNSHPYPPFITW